MTSRGLNHLAYTKLQDWVFFCDMPSTKMPREVVVAYSCAASIQASQMQAPLADVDFGARGRAHVQFWQEWAYRQIRAF